MKYIINEQNSCGQASLSESQRNLFLNALGYDTINEEESLNEGQASFDELASNRAEQDARDAEEMPTLYEWDSAVFALDEEVYEIDGHLFVKALELDEETRSHINESHEELFINQVEFDGYGFDLGDVYDMADETYIKLDEFKKGSKSKDKPEDKGDFETGARKGDKGAGKDKGDKPDFTTDQRKGDKSKTHAGKDFEKNGNGNGKGNGGDDENGDPRAFGGKKGDKSKTHKGRDFEQKWGGNKGDKSKTHPGRRDYEGLKKK